MLTIHVIYAAALCVHLLQPGTGHQVLCANVIRRADVSISQMTLSSRTVEVEHSAASRTSITYQPVVLVHHISHLVLSAEEHLAESTSPASAAMRHSLSAIHELSGGD